MYRRSALLFSCCALALTIAARLTLPPDPLARLGTLLALWTAPEAQAACNLIPAAQEIFPSTTGGASSPVATPGGVVKIQLTPCDTSDRFDLDPLNHPDEPSLIPIQ